MRLLKVILTIGCLVLGVVGATAQAKLKFALPWKGTWTIELAGDLSTITATTTTPKPQ